MANANWLILLLIAPLVASAAAFASRRLGPRTQQAVESVHLAGVTTVLVLALVVVGSVLGGEPLFALNNWLYVDSLATVFLSIIGVVGFLTGLYSIGYMRHDLETGEVDLERLSTYYGFFNLFLFTMLLVVTANNIVMMWVAVEATTLGSAFLVGLYGKKSSLEAAWKYVIICTVGVAFGLYGTVLVYADAANVLSHPETATLWTEIVKNAAALDPTIMKVAFVFVFIGFGTKAGIFPLHAWLPDAHSEAPSPASALLSAVLLKCALFIIIRYYMIVDRAIGPAFPQALFMIFGTLSLGAAAFFMFVQRDIKRLLAYSSVENVGIILLGLGLGGPVGILAALLHTVNHSLAKALMFCTSGNIVSKYGTRDLSAVKGLWHVAPVTSVLLIGGALTLGGLPPFNIFVSELWTVTAGVRAGYLWLMVVFLLLLTVVFARFIRLLGGSVAGAVPEGTAKGDLNWLTLSPIIVLLVLIVIMGLYVPAPVAALLNGATSVVLYGHPGASTASLTLPWP